MLTGADVIGQAQTGTGKTAAFALPILNNLQPAERHVQALVLCPTRELALQVADAIYDYGKMQDVRVLAVYGGQPYGPQISRLNRGVDVVVGTPGRLIDLLERNALNLSHVKTVVLDEADEMLSMGFIEDIETILGRNSAGAPDRPLLRHPAGSHPPPGRPLHAPAAVHPDPARTGHPGGHRTALLPGQPGG